MHTLSANGRPALIPVLLMGAALVLGGGGTPAPLPELALQLLAFVALAIWALVGPRALPTAAPAAWWIAGLVLALPLFQLVPLPPAVWQSLPGRDLEREALALVGAQDTWRPISVAPARTLAALLAIIVPAIVLIMTASLDRAGRGMVVAAIAGIGLLALLVGVAQMAGGQLDSFRFYVPDVGYLNGFQANHNSAADVLLVAMVAFAASVREWGARRRGDARTGYRLGLVAGACVLFSFGVFLTASRAGVFLLPVAWGAVVVIVRPWLNLSRRTVLAAAFGLLAVVVGVAILLQTNAVATRVADRFAFGNEFRPQLWRDALFAAREYLPWGAGMGAFVPVFLAIERLEVVDPSMPNRAHNEILELLVEGGVFGMALLAVIVGLLVRRALAAWRQPPVGSSAQVYFAVAVFCVFALHSQVDYPLRSMSLACIAAVAAGLLMPAAPPAGSNERVA